MMRWCFVFFQHSNFMVNLMNTRIMKTIAVAVLGLCLTVVMALGNESRAESHTTKEQTLKFIGGEVKKCKETWSGDNGAWLESTYKLENETLIKVLHGDGKKMVKYFEMEVLLEDIGEISSILICKDEMECVHYTYDTGKKDSGKSMYIEGCSPSRLTSITKALKHLQKLYDKQEKLF